MPATPVEQVLHLFFPSGHHRTEQRRLTRETILLLHVIFRNCYVKDPGLADKQLYIITMRAFVSVESDVAFLLILSTSLVPFDDQG